MALLVLPGSLALAQYGGVNSASAGARALSGIGASPSTTDSSSWQPWLSLTGNYTNKISTSQSVDFYVPSSANLSGGLGGSKQWRTKQISGGYTGTVMYRPNAPPTITRWRTAQTANVSYAQQLSRRLSFSLTQLGGISDGGYGFASGFGVNGVPGVTPSYGASDVGTDPSINGFVDNEILSGRVKYSLSGGDVSYLVSRRWSISISGNANFVRREQGFRGVNSFGGGASTDYQLSSKTTVGFRANVFTNSYTDQFGNVQGRQYSGAVQHQLNLTTMIHAQAGVAQIVSTFIGVFQLPPDLAELLGVSSSLQITSTNFWTPTYGLGLSKRFLIGDLSMSVSRGLGMGNGLVLAGMKDAASIKFGRELSSRIRTGISVGMVRASGRTGVARITQTAQSSLVVGYRLGKGFNLTGHAGFRYVGVAGYSRRSDFFTGGGIAWSPGERPFAF